MTHPLGERVLSFNERDMELIRQVADLKGITEAEAAQELMQARLARHFGRGDTPAKVYSLAARRMH